MGKLKEHFKKHKWTYICGGSSLIIGAGVGAALVRSGALNFVVTDAVKVQIASPTTNNIIVEMTRPGQTSHVVQCVETQEIWPSINQAAKSLNLSAFDISKNLRGLMGSVEGLTFRKLGEV